MQTESLKEKWVKSVCFTWICCVCLLNDVTSDYFQHVVKLASTKHTRNKQIRQKLLPTTSISAAVYQLYFCTSCSLSPHFLHNLAASIAHSLFHFLPRLFSTHSPLSALMRQSRRRTHLSGLMAAGGVLCTGGGAWLARMRSFRLLPCCKVIVIKSWLTVVDIAFEVQMSFPSILKSPLQHHLLVRSYKKKELSHTKY